MNSHVDPHRTLGFALKRLQQALRARMDTVLAEFGLTAPQYAVLALLADDPGLSNAELARRAFVTPPTMIRIVTALAELGLLARADPPVAGRVRATVLTARGVRLLNAAAVSVQEVENLLDGMAAPANREIILGWLNRSADDLDGR